MLLSSGDGNFTNGDFLAGGRAAYRIDIADIDSANGADIADPYMFGSALNVFLNTGGGSFPSSGLATTSVDQPVFAVAGNFTADSDVDVVVLTKNFKEYLLHKGDGTGSFTNSAAVSVSLDSTYVDLGAGDFNGDGLLDIAIPDSSTMNLDIYFGNGDGTFQAAVHVYVGVGTLRRLEIGDLNNNGVDDAAIISYSSDRLIVVIFR